MDLSKYLETMKNLPDRFSNLAFWRGVRKLKDEMVKTFEYVASWGTLIENNLTSLSSTIEDLTQGVTLANQNSGQAMGLANQAVGRLNTAFTVRDVDITSTVSPEFTTLYIPESEVPYPRVDQCILKFDNNNSGTVSTSDIIESAFFTGMFVLDGRNISFTHPVPLTPLYNKNSLSFLSPPIPLYKTSSSYSTSNFHFTIKVRCRRIPS